MDKLSTLPIYNEENGDVLDVRALNELVDFQRRNNPRLKDMSSADIADGSGIGITTYKGLLNGTNKNPRLDTVKRLIRFIGSGSIDILVRLAPRRDYEREQMSYNPTLVDAIQARLDAKIERIKEFEVLVEELKTNNKKLREEYTAACSDLSKAKEQIVRLDEYKVRVRRLAIWLGIAFVAVLILSGALVYFIWELNNPTRGNFQFY